MKPKAPTQSIIHICCYCEKTLPESQLHFIEEEYWLCDHCMREYTTTCSHCGEPILLENNAGSSETPLCNDCYDDHYNTCVRCGRVIHTDDTYYLDRYDDDPHCHDCYSRFSRDGGIQDYYYKPDPIFYGSGSRYFGVELEIDEAGESDDNAEQLQGSMTITVMDSSDNLYIIKGDNPLCLYHYPERGLYIYASTEEILKAGLKKLYLNFGKCEKISIESGEILKIDSSGYRTRSEFNDSGLYYNYCFPYHHSWDDDWWTPSKTNLVKMDLAEKQYFEDLKGVACHCGYMPEDIEELYEDGYTLMHLAAYKISPYAMRHTDCYLYQFVTYQKILFQVCNKPRLSAHPLMNCKLLSLIKSQQ